MKLYNIIFSFLEPTQAVATVGADSQEEAIQKLRSEAEQQVQGLEIIEVIEVGEMSPPETPTETPAFQPLPDNVIQFPGNTTKH